MPIKWSARQVSEACDMAEVEFRKLKEPLENAKVIVEAAMEIPNIPDYIKSRLMSLNSEIGRVLGGTYSWDNTPYAGCFDKHLGWIRQELPAGAAEQEKEKAAWGKQQGLI